MKLTVLEAFEEFVAICHPDGLTPNQRHDLRCCFVAAASWGLSLNPATPEDVGMAIMRALFEAALERRDASASGIAA